MATVSDTITWTSDEAGLREYMGIATGEDSRLARLLSVAVQAADTYLNNPFEDADGNDTLVDRTLDAIREGVYAYVFTYYTTTGTTASAAPGVASVRTGDLAVTYGGSSTGKLSPGSQALSAARPSWQPHQIAVWR